MHGKEKDAALRQIQELFCLGEFVVTVSSDNRSAPLTAKKPFCLKGQGPLDNVTFVTWERQPT